MSDLVSLVFGSHSALNACTGHLNLALESDAADSLLDRNKNARALIFSKLSAATIPQQNAVPSTEASLQEEDETGVDSVWGGSVRRINREGIPPQRLQERYWHPTRSLAFGDEETFEDNLRYFLESCDVFGGFHVFVEDSEALQACNILQAAGDHQIGNQSLQKRCMIFSFAEKDKFVSTRSATCLAKLGPIVTTYIPTVASSAPFVGQAINLITLPHRQEFSRTKLDMFTNLRPLTDVPGNISVSRLGSSTSNGPTNFGLSEPSLKICWGQLLVDTELVDSRERRPADWTYIFQSEARHVTSKASNLKNASLTVDHACAKWTEGLSVTLKSRVGVDYARLAGIESDEREDMVETLYQSFQNLEGVLHGKD